MDFGTLAKELETDGNREKQEKLAVYLNFFEFIATMETMKQINSDEIAMLFAYYFKLLTKSPVALKYINAYNYKNLRSFLQKYYSHE